MASYFQNPLGVDTIPKFVTARSPIGLRRAMALNTKKQKGYVQYHHIQWVESEKKWYAWFDVKEDKMDLASLSTGSDE
jgi:hypothetical protein